VLCCALLLGALAGCAPVATANTISVSDPEVSESAGSVTFVITRYIDALIAFGTDVSFQTTDVSAAQAADYAAASGTRSFGTGFAGTTQTHAVVVAVAGDALDEANETFRLAISGNEVGAGSFGTATILDDDAPPAVSVLDSATVTEGAGAQASFAVRLSAASGRAVSVSYATANGSATAGQDYSARSGTLTLSPGSVQAAVAVPVLDDGADEPAESFELRLASAVAATLGDAVATATIADNDEPPAPPPATPAGATQQPPPSPAVALPNLATIPSATTGSSTKAALGLSNPRLKRPSTVLMTISCPAASGRCSGRITIFSIASPKSRIKALRRERRLGRLTFDVAGGRSQTLELKLGRSDRALLRRTGRMRVRAYALTQDGAGRAGVRRVTGTLIARTAHSSPSGG
jgi:hypothetical protein